MRRETREDFLENIGHDNLRKFKKPKKDMNKSDLQSIIEDTNEKNINLNESIDNIQVKDKINSLISSIKDYDFTKSKLRRFNQ